MAININVANNQANQLEGSISDLRTARNKLITYRTSISNNWQGKEVGYILTAIDNLVREIDSAMNNLDSLSRDIKATASQIKKEEDAAEARARAAKQRRIDSLQNDYNEAKEEVASLLEKKEELVSKLSKASLRDKLIITNELQKLNEEIRQAEDHCKNIYIKLRSAKI